jgi:formate dehydrogenase subunit beta
MIGLIPVENSDTLTAVRSFLRQLVENGLVEALFVPLETDSGAITPALVTDPEQLARANPLAPAMPINSARVVSALTGKHTPARLGAVLRPCELRALIELVKLQQASLEDVTLISLDCHGTYEWTDFNALRCADSFDLAAFLTKVEGYDDHTNGHKLRQACQMCSQPVPEQADIQLQLFGADLANGIPVELEAGLANLLQVAEMNETTRVDRQAMLETLLKQRQQARQKELQGMADRIASDGGLPGIFEACIRCFNCSTVCPICYCKNCLFRTAAFDHKPEHYHNAARRKGAMRMPSDTMLFHLTRMNHMALSCVSCGMCTSACPADIPVGLVFSLVGEGVQDAFSYKPGKDIHEPLPLITFETNEWVEIGEVR